MDYENKFYRGVLDLSRMDTRLVGQSNAPVHVQVKRWAVVIGLALSALLGFGMGLAV